MKNITIACSKKINVLVLFLTIGLFTIAQPYQPVIESDSTSWDIAHHELFGIAMEKLYTNAYPDSSYSKLYLIGLYPDTNYVGKVREDTNTGKIWYCDIYNNEEILIMNLDLYVGDTFEIEPGIWSTVDSIFYQEEKKTIRFNLQTSWDEPVMFIEGVGPNISLFYPVDTYDYHYAACKYDQDNLVYVNNNINFNGCEPKPVGIKDNLENSKIQIYPNPASNVLYLKLPEAWQDNTLLQLYNITGKVIRLEVLSGTDHTISLLNLLSGLYLITINHKQQYHNQILIIN